MKNLVAYIILFMPAAAFAATGPVALGPNAGAFGDWTAASYGSGVDKACYAYTRASHAVPALAKRGPVLLTVSERQGAHDEVTLSAGFTYPKAAAVTLFIGTTKVNFYTQGGDAFTTGGVEAITAFKAGAAAEARSTGPHGERVTDDFSLAGFSSAYGAITAACP